MMSLFRSGPVSAGIPVSVPVWPSLGTANVTQPDAGFTADEGLSQLAEAGAGALHLTAEELIREAQLKAAEILQQAAAEAERAIAAARREGYEEGRQEGLAVGEGELAFQKQQVEWRLEKADLQVEAIRQAAEASAAAALAEAHAQAQTELMQAREEAAATLAQGRREQHRYLEEAQEAVVELAVTAAVRLVQGHLALQPAAIVAMVKAGLRRLKESDCTVRVQPQDLPLLEAQRSVLERELAGKVLTMQPDRSLAPGDFIVSSINGQIDGTLEQQAVQLHTALATALGGS